MARGEGRRPRPRGRGARRRRPRVLRRARHQAELRAARHRVEPPRPRRVPEPEVAEALEAGRVRGAGDVHRGRVLLPERGRRRRSAPTTRPSSIPTSRTGSCRPSSRSGSCAASGSATRCAWRSPATASGSRPRRHSASGWSPKWSSAASSGPTPTTLARLIASYPTVATQGTVRAIWESLDKPYRAAMEQGLMYTRLGNPIGAAEIERTGIDRTTPEDPVTASSRRAGSRAVMALDPAAPGTRVRGRAGTTVGRARRRRPTRSTDALARARPRRAARRSGCMLRNRPAALGLAARACCAPTLRGDRQPASRRRTAPRRPRRRSTFRCCSASARRPRRRPRADAAGDARRGALGALGGDDRRSRSAPTAPPCRRPGPGVAVRMLTSGTTGPPKRIDLRLRDARAGHAGRQALRDRHRHRREAPRRAW